MIFLCFRRSLVFFDFLGSRYLLVYLYMWLSLRARWKSMGGGFYVSYALSIVRKVLCYICYNFQV